MLTTLQRREGKRRCRPDGQITHSHPRNKHHHHREKLHYRQIDGRQAIAYYVYNSKQSQIIQYESGVLLFIGLTVDHSLKGKMRTGTPQRKMSRNIVQK